MTCVCSLAGTAACASCSNNPNSAKQYSNFITWANSAERTCRNVGYYIDGTRFECSECGYNGWTKWAKDGENKLPNYCPNCGAKVVGE